MLIAVASICAVISGFLISKKIISAFNRRTVIFSVANQTSQNRFDAWVTFATKIFGKVALRLVKFGKIKNLASRIVYLSGLSGVQIEEVGVISVLLGVSMLASVLAFLVTLAPVCPICVFLLVWVLTYTIVNNRIEKVASEMREQVPEALRAMAACSRSGLSLVQSLEETSKECHGPLKRILMIACDRLKLGALTTEALAVMRNTEMIPELKFVAVALNIQHTSGGSISPILESARESVMNEIELLRNLRVQTSQAKLSASIVTLMPFILLALFSFISPNFLGPFFSSPAGIVLFAVAIVMQFSGVMIVRRILNVSSYIKG